MECFLCERDATHECARCGALYCDAHGDALCERCSDPDLALPSHRLYRGSLLALFAGSIFALWLLIRPPSDGPGLAGPPIAPVVGPATIVLAPDSSPTPTPTGQPAAASPEPTRTAAPDATSTPTPSASPSPTPSPTATPSPTPTPTPSPGLTPTPSPTPYLEYTVEADDIFSAIVSRFLPDDADYGEFAARIIDINDIENAASLSIGQVLQIPRE